MTGLTLATAMCFTAMCFGLPGGQSRMRPDGFAFLAAARATREPGDGVITYLLHNATYFSSSPPDPILSHPCTSFHILHRATVHQRTNTPLVATVALGRACGPVLTDACANVYSAKPRGHTAEPHNHCKSCLVEGSTGLVACRENWNIHWMVLEHGLWFCMVKHPVSPTEQCWLEECCVPSDWCLQAKLGSRDIKSPNCQDKHSCFGHGKSQHGLGNWDLYTLPCEKPPSTSLASPFAAAAQAVRPSAA